jgi:hypothetical protein
VPSAPCGQGSAGAGTGRRIRTQGEGIEYGHNIVHVNLLVGHTAGQIEIIKRRISLGVPIEVGD